MRKVLVAGLAGLFLLAVVLTGCGDSGKAKIPEKPIEVPKGQKGALPGGAGGAKAPPAT
jgi:hypothetical protein